MALAVSAKASVPIVLFQEHMLPMEIVPERDRAIRNKGLKPHWEPATRRGGPMEVLMLEC